MKQVQFPKFSTHKKTRKTSRNYDVCNVMRHSDVIFLFNLILNNNNNSKLIFLQTREAGTVLKNFA
jgi:hypothetical protein